LDSPLGYFNGLGNGGGLSNPPASSRTARTAAGIFELPADAMSGLDINLLFASLIWGSIGVGYAIYGKRQKSIVPLIGGILMVLASYVAGSVFTMSAISLGLMAAIYFLCKQGY
jgi:hypothetical protein